jgi:hypothetical protein
VAGELVRLVIVQALLDAGFEVMEAEHAEAALIVLESHGHRIHVLFTDIQMPGTMDGLALAHHASKHWPWMGLLVTLGPAPLGSHHIARAKPICDEAIPAPRCHWSYSRASGGSITPPKAATLVPVRTDRPLSVPKWSRRVRGGDFLPPRYPRTLQQAPAAQPPAAAGWPQAVHRRGAVQRIKRAMDMTAA